MLKRSVLEVTRVWRLKTKETEDMSSLPLPFVRELSQQQKKTNRPAVWSNYWSVMNYSNMRYEQNVLKIRDNQTEIHNQEPCVWNFCIMDICNVNAKVIFVFLFIVILCTMFCTWMIFYLPFCYWLVIFMSISATVCFLFFTLPVYQYKLLWMSHLSVIFLTELTNCLCWTLVLLKTTMCQ